MKLFEIKKIERSKFEIFVWWEFRRFLFNALLILFTSIGFKILGITILKMEMGSGEYFLFIGIILLLIILNFFYTFGWIIELFRERSLTFAPTAFKNFTAISITLICGYIGFIYILLS